MILRSKWLEIMFITSDPIYSNSSCLIEFFPKYFSNACKKQLYPSNISSSNPLRVPWKKKKVEATLCVNNFYAPLTGVLIARPRAGYSSNHNRSDCSDFSHRLPPFNRFETKLQIELKTFIVALPSGDGNSRAEFDWNLAGGERERENLQGSATLAARTAVSNFPDVSGLSRLLCATSSLLRWLHSISLFGQDQCFKRNFRLVAAFRFEHWFPPLLEDSSELYRSIRARLSC